MQANHENISRKTKKSEQMLQERDIGERPTGTNLLIFHMRLLRLPKRRFLKLLEMKKIRRKLKLKNIAESSAEGGGGGRKLIVRERRTSKSLSRCRLL